MVIIFPDTALVWLLLQVANTMPGLIYHLYTNPVAWSPQTALIDLIALDPVFPPQTVPLANWIVSGVQDDIGFLQAPSLTWTNNSGVNQTVYGYFVTDGTGAVLVMGGQFDGAPLTVQPLGTVQAVPVLGSYSASDAS